MRHFLLYTAVVWYFSVPAATAAVRYGEWLLEQPRSFVLTLSFKQSAPLNDKIATSELWPAPGFTDTELGVLMEPEVDHGEAEVYARVQA